MANILRSFQLLSSKFSLQAAFFSSLLDTAHHISVDSSQSTVNLTVEGGVNCWPGVIYS
jgi:hypothetical protein